MKKILGHSFRKRGICLLLTFSLLLSLIAGCGPQQDAEGFTVLMDEIFLESVASDTFTLHFSLVDPESYGITDYDITLGSLNIDSFCEDTVDTENCIKRLKSIDRNSLTEEQQLTYDIVLNYMEDSLCPESYFYFAEPLSPIEGIQGYLPTYFAEYDFNKKQDIEDYLALYEASYEYFEEIIAFEKEKAKRGLFMTDTMLDQVLDQCESILNERDDFFLTEIFDEKLEEMTELSAEEKEDFRKRNQENMETYLFPAYELLAESLEPLRGSGTNEEGICNYENGTEYYEYLVKCYTGSRDSVDEIYRKMQKTSQSALTEASMAYAADNTLYNRIYQLTYPETDPEKILVYLQDAMKEDFPALENVTYHVNHVPAALSQYLSPAFYMIPPIDRETDNSIYLNDADGDLGSELFPTMAHEGFPGHMYQNIYFSRENAHPIRHLMSFISYSEGWAMYVENYSYTLAGFGETLTHFIYGLYMSSYLAHSMADIGIHYYGWSREEAVNFFTNLGFDPSGAESAVELIQQNPGYYVKYMYGYMEFEMLRDMAEEKEDFNPKEYHEFILKTGPCQFYLLEDMLEDWIEE